MPWTYRLHNYGTMCVKADLYLDGVWTGFQSSGHHFVPDIERVAQAVCNVANKVHIRDFREITLILPGKYGILIEIGEFPLLLAYYEPNTPQNHEK